MDKPNYYSVIPATVRYDNRLKANEKLMYGEITALCNKEGYCWAGNEYFAKLYGTRKETVSRWMSNLKKLGYIRIELVRTGGKEIGQRKIYLLTKKSSPIDKKVNTPIDEKVKDNTTSNEYSYLIKDIVEYLNQKANKTFKHSTKTTQQHIRSRINEGFSVDDFKKVIDIKVAEWQDTDMDKFLRPSTLFGTKFESYLNQKAGVTNAKSKTTVGRFDHLKDREWYGERS